MRPADVANKYSFDYTSSQKSVDAFDGTLLFTWLIKIQDIAASMDTNHNY